MSASNKKKLRKEQQAEMLTEKQRREQAEAKKVKSYTIAFIAILLVIVLTTVGTLGVRAVNHSGVFERNTIAATIGDHKLNTVMMGYYYNDAINNAYSQWYNDYGSNINTYTQWLLGLDLSKSLNKQVYNAESGMTWAGYFVSIAMDNAKSDYALYDLAVAEGFKLSEEDTASIDNMMSNLSFYARLYGYSNTNKYLQATYGYGSSEKTYRQYCEISATANAYYKAHQDSLTYDDAAIRAHEKDRFNEYSSYSGAYYYLSYTYFLEGGTKDEDGHTTYTDAERDVARKAAKENADRLALATSAENLDTLIKDLSIKDGSENPASNKYENTLYSNLNSNEDVRKWFSDSNRKEGDATVIENSSTTTDEDGKETTTINGYYVLFFESKTDNTMKLANVRHILVKPEGGTKNSDGTYNYTDEEKKAAKEKADELLKQWKDGDATEESFIAMVTEENSADTGSIENGGLFEDITPDSAYVEGFLDWAVDPARKAGDVDVVWSVYGYHIMYFVGHSDVTYRDYLITNDLRTDDMKEWYDGLLENTTLVEGNTKRLKLDIVLG